MPENKIMLHHLKKLNVWDQEMICRLVRIYYPELKGMHRGLLPFLSEEKAYNALCQPYNWKWDKIGGSTKMNIICKFSSLPRGWKHRTYKHLDGEI